VQTLKVPANPIDEDIFHRFRSGDEEASVQVVQRWHRPLVGFLLAKLESPELAEDVAHDALVEAFRQRSELRSSAQLGSWLFTVALRLARKAQQRPQPVPISGNEQALSMAAPSTSPLLGEHRRRALDQVLPLLSDDERDLILLRFFGRFQHQELATITGCPLGTVGVKLSRTLEKLRRLLLERGYRAEDLLE
jgi:RNA polymerase sigma-70 factor (ECF subfamily)